MTDWQPDLYRRFEGERTRPARDLLAAVPLEGVRLAYDLGCGPGNSTELVARRFPEARIVGTDTSEAMLAAARERLPDVRFEQSDIGAWTPAEPPDLVFANAALHWVPDHATAIPRLFETLAPGGVLAFQMPDNREEPSHRAMRDLALVPPFDRLIDASASERDVLAPERYYDLLAPHAARVEVWRTVYQHPLASPAAIVAWVESTGLRPFLDPLPPAEREAFCAAYEGRVAAAYPARADGLRLLAFPRLFVVATRRNGRKTRAIPEIARGL